MGGAAQHADHARIQHQVSDQGGMDCGLAPGEVIAVTKQLQLDRICRYPHRDEACRHAYRESLFFVPLVAQVS